MILLDFIPRPCEPLPSEGRAKLLVTSGQSFEAGLVPAPVGGINPITPEESERLKAELRKLFRLEG